MEGSDYQNESSLLSYLLRIPDLTKIFVGKELII